jgi:N-acyl-D-amino-acid deacylase
MAGALTVEQAVRELSAKPAETMGLHDRGRIAPGFKADLNVIDLDRLHLHAPHVRNDLPAGGRRLDQAATGFVATIVSGQVIRRNDRPTNARPGALVRGAKAAPQPASETEPLEPGGPRHAGTTRLFRDASESANSAAPAK